MYAILDACIQFDLTQVFKSTHLILVVVLLSVDVLTVVDTKHLQVLLHTMSHKGLSRFVQLEDVIPH